jgi:hypothetical protein
VPLVHKEDKVLKDHKVHKDQSAMLVLKEDKALKV